MTQYPRPGSGSSTDDGADVTTVWHKLGQVDASGRAFAYYVLLLLVATLVLALWWQYRKATADAS